MAVTDLLAVAMVVGLCLYLVFGGADFGGGVWDLLASGPRRDQQRSLIEHAIGPIWEANHVWLILVVVVLFSAFPPAFAALSIALHVPLTLFLLGVVLRGSSFAFRSFSPDARFGLVFSVASVVAPVLLGAVVGAAASGNIHVAGGAVSGGYYAPWLAPFPIVTGLFALALCAYLAAVYLTNEATSAALAEDFRRRALGAGAAAAVLAALTLALAFRGAPRIALALLNRPWAWLIEAGAALAAGVSLQALVGRRYRRARLVAPVQVALIVIGWAAAQYPYLVVGDVSLDNAASGPATQRLLLVALLAGLPVLLPSLYLMFRIFKTPAGRSASR
jgi:cytochrome d ubiquinol oxidase subunit II